MTIHAWPKPRPSPPKAKKPLPRSTKPIPKVNLKAKVKRDLRKRRHYGSKAYKTARAAAMERAGNQCEYICWWYYPSAGERREERCEATEHLQFHEERYNKTGRSVQASDGKILCVYHHHLTEMRDHPTRNRSYR